ncbi:MAG: hypothetical protein AB8Y91_02695, partial [Coxiella endosymbiont of Haemaphysalis japonica]
KKYICLQKASKSLWSVIGTTQFPHVVIIKLIKFHESILGQRRRYQCACVLFQLARATLPQ